MGYFERIAKLVKSTNAKNMYAKSAHSRSNHQVRSTLSKDYLKDGWDTVYGTEADDVAGTRSGGRMQGTNRIGHVIGLNHDTHIWVRPNGDNVPMYDFDDKAFKKAHNVLGRVDRHVKPDISLQGVSIEAEDHLHGPHYMTIPSTKNLKGAIRIGNDAMADKFIVPFTGGQAVKGQGALAHELGHAVDDSWGHNMGVKPRGLHYVGIHGLRAPKTPGNFRHEADPAENFAEHFRHNLGYSVQDGPKQKTALGYEVANPPKGPGVSHRVNEDPLMTMHQQKEIFKPEAQPLDMHFHKARKNSTASISNTYKRVERGKLQIVKKGKRS